MFDYVSQALQTDKAQKALVEADSSLRAVSESYQLPNRKTEDWKYSSLVNLTKADYVQRYADLSPSDESIAELVKIDALDCYRAVFVNGDYRASLSTLDINSDVACCEIVRESSEERKHEFSQRINSCIDLEKHQFVGLNTLNVDDALWLQVAASKQLDKPLHIFFVNTKAEQCFHVNPRVLVELAPNSEATVIEHYLSCEGEQNSLTNAVSELYLADNSQLTHYRIQEEQEAALHIGAVHVQLSRSANLNSFNFALGSKFKRIDFVVNHSGEGAHSQLNGVYLPINKQHIDFHTCIEHTVPNCTSDEVFRGIIADSSRAVFNGRIHIHRDAQKTLANMSNKNLLTSNKAEIDTKPELEIYADDVRCAHGATIAQLQGESLHYFKTRGISANDARVMLSFGFINELIEGLADDAVANYLRPIISNIFMRDGNVVGQLVE